MNFQRTDGVFFLALSAPPKLIYGHIKFNLTGWCHNGRRHGVLRIPLLSLPTCDTKHLQADKRFEGWCSQGAEVISAEVQQSQRWQAWQGLLSQQLYAVLLQVEFLQTLQTSKRRTARGREKVKDVSWEERRNRNVKFKGLLPHDSVQSLHCFDSGALVYI